MNTAEPIIEDQQHVRVITFNRAELALAYNLRIASETSTIGLPEVKRGMATNFASVMLKRLIPRAIALEMLHTGDRSQALRP
jgi:enoyl-CoA hydratase/carnithine racemase